MNPNPAAPAGPSGTAQDALNVPSLLILIMGGLGVLFALYGLVSGGSAIPASMLEDPKMAEMFAKINSMGRGGNVIGIVLDGVMIYGALQMRQAKNYGLSLASAIIVMLPCAGCCCLLGLPIGIWAIVTMNKPEIKSQFS